MLSVIHGDNIVVSRNYLNSLINQTKAKGVKETIRLDGKETSLTQVIQALESTSLFGTDRLVIIENIFSRSKSKEKQDVLSYLSETKIAHHLIIWESKAIHSNALKKFKFANIKLFKTSATIFKFLDSLKPNNSISMIKLMDESIATDSAEMVFYMLVRQIRLLLLALEPKTLKLAPWQVNKLKAQAHQFGQKQLTMLHQKLLDIDERIKTGQSLLGLAGELDLLLLSL